MAERGLKVGCEVGLETQLSLLPFVHFEQEILTSLNPSFSLEDLIR